MICAGGNHLAVDEVGLCHACGHRLTTRALTVYITQHRRQGVLGPVFATSAAAQAWQQLEALNAEFVILERVVCVDALLNVNAAIGGAR